MKQPLSQDKIHALDRFELCEFIEQFEGSDRIDAVSSEFMSSLKRQLKERGKHSFGLSNKQKDWVQVIYDRVHEYELVD